MQIITTASSLTLLERIGVGGFGEVWRAKRTSGGIEQEVAVKILKADGADFVHRLRDEARLLARLKHNSIVKMLDFAEVRGQPAVIMEYVEGADLKKLIKSGPVPLRALLQIGVDLASAMVEAHRLSDASTGESLGLIHRDLKPENIRITPRGEVKLLDFGIAKASFEEREAQTGSMLLASKGYMPPERALLRDEQVGDVYSLALVLAEGFTGSKIGQCPILPDDPSQWKIAYHRWQDTIRTRLKGAPEGFIRLMLRCTAFSPEQRPSMAELEPELDLLLDHANGLRLKEWAPAALRNLPKEERVPAPAGMVDTVQTNSKKGNTGLWLLGGGLGLGTALMVVCTGGLLVSQLPMFKAGETAPGTTSTPLTAPVPPSTPTSATPTSTAPTSTAPTSTAPASTAPTSSVPTSTTAPAKNLTPAASQKTPPAAAKVPDSSAPVPQPPVVPSPEVAPPPPLPTTGTIEVTGASGRLLSAGNLAAAHPGDNQVEVRFPSGKTLTLTVKVTAGSTTHVVCNSSFETCPKVY